MGKELCNLIDSANIKETLLVSRCNVSRCYGYLVNSDFSVTKSDNITGRFLQLTYNGNCIYTAHALKNGRFAPIFIYRIV